MLPGWLAAPPAKVCEMWWSYPVTLGMSMGLPMITFTPFTCRHHHHHQRGHQHTTPLSCTAWPPPSCCCCWPVGSPYLAGLGQLIRV